MGESLLPDVVVRQGLINGCLTRGADFEAYTGPMKADESVGPGRYIVNMIGSSTIKDLQGDIMTLSALDDMTKVPDNLTILLNHSTDIPDSIFGGLASRPYVQSSRGIADLHLSAEVETSNPKAMQTYAMIAKGRRLGCSIGCLVLDYDFDEDSSTILIRSVNPVEWSIVSVPACQRCWVEVAAKSLFERALMEGNGDKAYQLAPAVRGMYTRAYDRLIKHVSSPGLRIDLERVQPRPTHETRIMQVFNDDSISFGLANMENVTKSLKRDEVSALLEKSNNFQVNVFAGNTTAHHEVIDHDVPIVRNGNSNITPTYVELDADDLNVTDDTWELTAKSVSGKTSWPLMDIGTQWDGGKATKQIFDWARDDNGDIVASKAKQCHLYYNPDEADTQAGYKMPYVYLSDGSPKIVPLGVRACAGVLSGGMGGVSASDTDKNDMKAKVKTMYGRINSQFHPDPEWIVPWEKDDSNKSIADSNSDAPLNRQDLEEGNMPKGKKKADDVEVSADGTHAPMTGTHSHSHKAFGSQGEDDQHSHSHSHDNDANHDHAHDDSEGSNGDAEKGLEPAITKSSSETPVQTENAQIITTEPNTSIPAQDVSSENEAPATIVKSEEPQETDHRLVLLRSIATQLGLPESVIAPTATKSMAISQDVITCISNIDNLADALDDAVDMLMGYFNIPDIDDDEPTDSPGYTRYSLETRLERALAGIMRTKEGREISAKNRDNLQTIHDCVKAMHPGCCAGVQSETVDEATDNAREQGEGRPLQEQYSLTIAESLKSIDGLTKSLADINIKSVVQSEVNAALEEARKKLLAINSDQQTLMDNIRKLKEMPLGRPTTLAGRRTVVQEDTATYHDLLTAGVKPLESLTEDDLEVVEKGSMRMKLWPAGFKAGQRPPLTESQKMYMSPLDYYPYEQALRDVCVPILEEQRA